MTGTHDTRAWVIKLNGFGEIVWQRSYGSAGGNFIARSVSPVAAGGFVLAGQVSPGHLGGADAWVVRLDERGDVIWQKTFGGPLDEWVNAVRPTRDGGFVVAGSMYWMDSGTHRDAWVLLLDAQGEIVWQRSYGGTGEEGFAAIEPVNDDGFVAAGYTFSFGAGGQEAWVVRLDPNGGVIWQRAYGSPGADATNSIRLARDGGFIVAGMTDSGAAGPGAAAPAGWIMKLDIDGTIAWQKIYQTASVAGSAAAAAPTPDGGYAVAGFDFNPSTRAWVIKLDAMGYISNCTRVGDGRAAVVATSAASRDSAAVTLATGTAWQATIANAVAMNEPTVDVCTGGSLSARPRAIEYYRSAFDHYFATSMKDEIDKLDSAAIEGWVRTGHAFYVDAVGTEGSSDVCRFWTGQAFAPKSSHFFTPRQAECANTMANPNWLYEGQVFAFKIPDMSGTCGADTTPLYRLYNKGMSGAPNHRHTTSMTARAAMLDRGWLPEGWGTGVIGCVAVR